jgi:ComF family protein
MIELLRQTGTALLDVLYPPVCLLCNAYAEPLCEGCRAQIRPVPPEMELPVGLEGVLSVGYHEEALRTAVLKLKFQRDTALAPPLGTLLADVLQPYLGEWRAGGLVPVPIHWARRWERGFNQSELLAQRVSRILSVPVRPVLLRTRKTPPQVGLEASARQRNIQGAFALAPQVSVEGQRLILVDDVRTTGSTLTECAAVLKSAGAQAVYGLTLTFDA